MMCATARSASIADAIRVVKADGLTNAVFSTPAVGRVQVRDDDRIDTRWVVVFGAQNGAMYAIDALGDGVNGTRRGETKLYWILKPPNSASFSYASPLHLENLNKVVIGNLAGTVYFIPTDFDPNAPPDELNVTSASGLSTAQAQRLSPRLLTMPDTGLVYIGAAEGGDSSDGSSPSIHRPGQPKHS
jgi:hypothetical protein